LARAEKRPRRGRPIGWRKANARRLLLVIRLRADERRLLDRRARRDRVTVASLLRDLIEKPFVVEKGNGTRTESVMIRLSDDEYQAIARIARCNHVTMSRVLRDQIARYL
jgi:hypothetical protein